MNERESVAFLNGVTEAVIGAAIAVHRVLGPGLFESAYEACLAYELERRGIPFRRQVALPIQYGDVSIVCGFKVDFVVEERVVVELKAVKSLTDLHDAQLLAYLKLSGCRVGLMLNFNTVRLVDGIRRLVNDL